MKKFTLLSLESIVYYDIGVRLQKLALDQIQKYNREDFLILLRHSPTITKGNSSKDRNIIASVDFLKNNGIEVYDTERGGDVTYHGPGQLMCYPVIDLHRKNIHDYKSRLCQTIIDVLDEYGIKAEEKHKKLSGIWVDDKKIAAIGYAVKKFYENEKLKVITQHGAVLYVLDEMENFQCINPCGTPNMPMTNMEKLLGKKIDFEELKEKYVQHFSRRFKYDIVKTIS